MVWFELPYGLKVRPWFAWYPVRLGVWPRFKSEGWAWMQWVALWEAPEWDGRKDIWHPRIDLWSSPDFWFTAWDGIEARIRACRQRYAAQQQGKFDFSF